MLGELLKKIFFVLILLFSLSVFSQNIVLNNPGNGFESKSVFVEFSFTPLNKEITECLFYNNEFDWSPKLSFEVNSNAKKRFTYTFSSEGKFEWNVLCKTALNEFWAEEKNKIIVINSINGSSNKVIELEEKEPELINEEHDENAFENEHELTEENHSEKHEIKHPEIDLILLFEIGAFFSLLLAGIALIMLIKSKFSK